MALAPLEVLIYALVVTGNPVPTECSLKADKSIQCTNGVTATEDRRAGALVFAGKPLAGKTVKVQYARDGSLLFSNGVTASRTATGWIKFSNGVEARRDMSGATNTFLVAPDLVCTEDTSAHASCRRR